MYGVILAGGSGSRLWPMSRELYPKQLLNMQNEDSLLQATYKRLAKFIPHENIIATTGVKHLANVKSQLSKDGKGLKVLSEPISRNTAPAIAIAVKNILTNNEDEDDVVLVVPSDHVIRDIEKFKSSVEKGEQLAKQGYLVTFGVQPSYPETGYGYIKVSDALGGGFKVDKFVEKPDYDEAEVYVKTGKYFWNSGIFMFRASVFMGELKKHSPEIFCLLERLDFSKSDEVPYIEYERMPNISVDYAVMEKSDKIALVKLECDWSDLGSWSSIYESEKKDENGNAFVGHVIDIDSKNSLVYSSSKLCASIGLEDTVIVETEDAILACKKDRTQDVKKIYDILKQQNDDTHLIHKTVFRPWGFYTVLNHGDGFLTKMIQVNPGQKLSVQSHNFRSEHWVILAGTAKVVLEGKDYILSPGNSIDIPLKAIHSLQNPYNEPIKVIEVQLGDPLIEEDIIRYEDMYGRV